MADDIYRRLALYLDSLPGGFPSTESGVEIRILQRLFSPMEADLAMHLTLIPEESKVIAARAGVTVDEAEKRLEQMALKGLLFRIELKRRPPLYMSAQYVIGIWEYHLNDLDPQLIRDMNEYIPTLFDIKAWKKAPQLRTIPVNKSLTVRQDIMHYEDARELVTSKRKIIVAPCICRREHKMIGEGCGKEDETCLVFGLGAEYYHKNGLGRFIDSTEALEILEKADKEALVLQPSNAKKIVNICCCCGCCCQILRSFKRYPRPSDLVSSPFRAEFKTADCEGCGVCVERCQMDALRLEDGVAVLDGDRCIGCGLCVTTCPTGALRLVRKPEKDQPRVPANMTEAYIRLGKARGKMSNTSLVKMQLKSKLDRLMASGKK